MRLRAPLLRCALLLAAGCHGAGQGADLSAPADLARGDLGAGPDLAGAPDLTAVMSNGLAVSTLATGTFTLPVGIAVDPRGPSLWVADTGNHTVQRLDAGSGAVLLTLGVSGTPGFENGGPGVATFRFPIGVTVGADGAVYVADSENHAIRKITLGGATAAVSTLAGGTRGKMDGTGAAAQFNQPSGVTTDAAGTVYVADTINCALRTISPAGASGTIFGPACTGVETIYLARAVLRDPDGVFYTSDPSDHRLMRIAFTAGMGHAAVYAGSASLVGRSGDRDGPAAQALFNTPYGLAFDPQGNILVADQDNHRVRRVLAGAAPRVETVAGTGAGAAEGDALTRARFNGPRGVAADAAGVIYVADTGNRSIRKIARSP